MRDGRCLRYASVSCFAMPYVCLYVSFSAVNYCIFEGLRYFAHSQEQLNIRAPMISQSVVYLFFVVEFNCAFMLIFVDVILSPCMPIVDPFEHVPPAPPQNFSFESQQMICLLYK